MNVLLVTHVAYLLELVNCIIYQRDSLWGGGVCVAALVLRRRRQMMRNADAQMQK
jgi:hypothetical protein